MAALQSAKADFAWFQRRIPFAPGWAGNLGYGTFTMTDTSTSEPAKPIAIVGAGIGGLSAAIALRRAGFEACVYERAPELGEVGAGIGLWPNATRLLRRWGVLDEVLRRGHVVEDGALRSADGRTLTRFRFAHAGAPHLLIHRADLHAALVDALPPWAVTTAAELARYEETEGGVRAWLGGVGAVEAAALVGADGIRSAVRAQLLGDGAPVYRGYPVWRGVVRWGEDEPMPELTESLGAGLRFGTVPLGRGRVAWWATANEPAGTDDGPEGRKAKLVRLFRGWHDPVPRLIDATPEGEILKNDTYDRPPVRGWGRGRVTLLGDAAHPTTPNFGQGGCMAIEDAAVLAACLVETADVPRALRAYEERRFGRTKWIVEQSRRYGAIGQWASPLAVRVRKALFRLTPQFVTDLTVRKMFAFDG
jgi:2-polyprenyl-6-methoxyphenol hydroxylase-like FAD-dependent oxidoreductase